MKNKILQGDVIESLKTVPDGIVNTCVTSPPYWGLRDYGEEGQIGLEKTPELFVEKMVEVFKEVKRVLKDDGTLWLNLGDSYAGSMKGINADGTAVAGPKQATNKGSVGIIRERPPRADAIGLKSKDLVGIPWRVAFALQADGWYLRQDIIWHKPNPMPESVRDRCTKAHEYIFLLSKKPKYYFDHASIREPAKWERWGKQTVKKQYRGIKPVTQEIMDAGRKNGKNKRSVWTVNLKPFRGAHFATFPEELIKPCILAGCPKGGLVLDPFFGAGTTGLVAKKNDRDYLGCELNPEYIKISEKRIESEIGGLFE